MNQTRCKQPAFVRPAARWLGAGTLAISLAGCTGLDPTQQASLDRWRDIDEQRYGHESAYQNPAENFAPLAEARPDSSPTLPGQPGLEDYLAHGLHHHPGLEAAFHEWRAALEDIDQARALPDPQLSYSYFIRQSMNRQTFGLSQTFPWYQRLQARADVALEEALAAEQRFEARRLEIFSNITSAYAEYAHLARNIAIVEENRDLLESLEESARALYETGDTPYADVAQAQVQLAEIEDRLTSLADQRAAASARLAAAIGRDPADPASAALPWPRPLEPTPLNADQDQLQQRLARHNPELLALAHESGAQRHTFNLAGQNRIPDLMLGLEYMDMVDLRDQVALMASVNLPLWRQRLDAERRQALAGFAAATRRQTDRRHALQADLQQALFNHRDAGRRIELYETRLIPLAEQSLESVESAYAVGETEFQTLINAQTVLLEFQLTQQRALADQLQSAAELDRLTGSAHWRQTPPPQNPPNRLPAGNQ